MATFTLDYGTCPRWLFERMVKLGREMVRVVVAEEGPEAFIRRLSDPVWFQSLGTVLAFDWNASGLTTILTAALKEAIRGEESDLGIFICGGKGKTSRKTPDQILDWGGRLNLGESHTNALVYNSRMSAKVDSSLVQDGFQLYHHCFFFTKSGAWTVVQQGMNKENKTARRYHWHSESAKDLVCEPHAGIASQVKIKNVLNLTAAAGGKNREISTELVTRNGFQTLMKDLRIISAHVTSQSEVLAIAAGQQTFKFLNLLDRDFTIHPVVEENFAESRYLQKILWQLCDKKPENYEKLLSIEGVGPKTMRALALVAEVIYGAKPAYEDPARYSFAHGGKDAIPYPVDRPTYDRTIKILGEYVRRTKLPALEKDKIQKRLRS